MILNEDYVRFHSGNHEHNPHPRCNAMYSGKSSLPSPYICTIISMLDLFSYPEYGGNGILQMVMVMVYYIIWHYIPEDSNTILPPKEQPNMLNDNFFKYL
jgi:hypothetical protein